MNAYDPQTNRRAVFITPEICDIVRTKKERDDLNISEGCINYGLQVGDYCIQYDQYNPVHDNEQIANLVLTYANNYSTRKQVLSDYRAMGVIIERSSNEPLTFRQRFDRYGNDMKNVINTIRFATNGIRKVDVYECICVFHDMQTQEHQICSSWKTDPTAGDQMMHNDHFHVVFLFDKRYGNTVNSHSWFKAFKHEFKVRMLKWTMKTESLDYVHTSLEYLRYQHKTLLIHKKFSNVINSDDVMDTFLLPEELKYLYYNSQARRELKKYDLNVEDIVNMLSEVIIRYGTREVGLIVKRTMKEMKEVGDDRWSDLYWIYIHKYPKLVKQYHPQAMDIAFGTFITMSLDEFIDNYIDLFGTKARESFDTQHASLEDSLPYFYDYCTKALSMTVKEVTRIFYHCFNRTGQDRKKNTIFFVSGPSCGKTYLLRSIWAACPLYANIPQEDEEDKFKWASAQSCRFMLLNELKISDGNVDMLKTIMEGSETHVAVKHKERVTLNNVPIFATTNHEVWKNMSDAYNIEAIMHRIHVFRPRRVNDLKEIPYLHPGVWQKGEEYERQKELDLALPPQLPPPGPPPDLPRDPSDAEQSDSSWEDDDDIELLNAAQQVDPEPQRSLTPQRSPSPEQSQRTIPETPQSPQTPQAPKKKAVKRRIIDSPIAQKIQAQLSQSPKQAEFKAKRSKVNVKKSMTELCRYVYETDDFHMSMHDLCEFLRKNRPYKANQLHDIAYAREVDNKIASVLFTDEEEDGRETVDL